jgi:hypothetical protein
VRGVGRSVNRGREGNRGQGCDGACACVCVFGSGGGGGGGGGEGMWLRSHAKCLLLYPSLCALLFVSPWPCGRDPDAGVHFVGVYLCKCACEGHWGLGVA